MAQTRDPLDDLEKYRLQLEQSIAQLSRALKHWQTWEAEYEAFKEALDILPPYADKTALFEAGTNVEGELVTKTEVDELLGRNKGISRTATQVTDLLARRIDYVQRNVESLQKQLDAAEVKVANAIILSEPDARTEEGLPVTDIYEELDAEGNVISSKVIRPGDAAPDILGTLQKAGVDDSDLLDDGEIASPEDANVSQISVENSGTVSSGLPSQAEPMVVPAPGLTTRSRKKSVSFAEGTKEASETPSEGRPEARAVAGNIRPARPSPTTIDASGQNTGSHELDDDETAAKVRAPVIPIDESEEDAALRREMLQYSMSEVGSIVAQLDIDDSDASYSSDAEAEAEDVDFDLSASSDDENEFGLSTGTGIGAAYRKEMLELERRLNARVLRNVGPQPDLLQPTSAMGAKTTPDDSISSASMETDADEVDNKAQPKEKSVRFAETLDIAPPPQPLSPQAQGANQLPPLNDRIVERMPQTSGASGAPENSRKASRFKSARSVISKSSSNQTSQDSSSTTNNPLASRIVERPLATTERSLRPSSPDELDPALLRQQVATEYYRQRNNMIQKQGGFSRKRQEEQEMEETWDDRRFAEFESRENFNGDGERKSDEDADAEPPKKMSLFKAARLKRSGAS